MIAGICIKKKFLLLRDKLELCIILLHNTTGLHGSSVRRISTNGEGLEQYRAFPETTDNANYMIYLGRCKKTSINCHLLLTQ